MSFRTVVVKSRAKIETRLNWLLIRGEEEKWVHLGEIGTLIIESTACAITAQALCELVKNNTSIIFCDEKHLPYGQLALLYGNHLTSGQVKRQSQWSDLLKAKAWQEIIKQKIEWQKCLLIKYDRYEAANLLSQYIEEVEDGDKTNREGHAAKVYFNALLGQDFGRRTEQEINSALNYGYAILLSSVSREIVAAGYITQVGIHHINEFNQFNLASDIMEAFRPLVDAYALSISDFDNFKSRMTAVLTSKIRISDKEHYLDSGIRIYVRNVLKFMEGNGEILKIERFILEEGNEL
ncbi:MAG: type II CRISPR-associated endonuclease Cas1 [Firmicutes bacterium]|nr:type II CRISPR-associated endonuclease Cas1 [Bacillota bacterium]